MGEVGIHRVNKQFLQPEAHAMQGEIFGLLLQVLY